MKVEFKKENNEIKIYLIGELGNFEARKAMKEIETILMIYREEDVILDLSKITFMDSSGIAIIMRIFKNTKDIRGFTVANSPNVAMKIFKTTGVSKFVNFA